MLIKFNKQTANESDFRKELLMGTGLATAKQYAQYLQKNDKPQVTNKIFDLIDTCSVNPIWRAEFQRAFNKALGTKAQFDTYTDEERKVQKEFTVTGGVAGTSIADLFETNILPIVDGLLFDNSPVLSRVSMINAGENDGNQSFDLNEFGGEIAGENLDEDDAGTEADDVVRVGDTLTPKHKIQASTSFTEYALMTMRPDLLGRFVARLVKREENRLVLNTFAGSNASNQFKGIINSFGTGENDQEGALQYIASGATDNVDKVLEMAGDLPDAVTESEESNFAYYMTRSTWYQRIRLVTDANDNYKVNSVITETGGQRTLNGLPVIFVGFGIQANRVILADLSNYFIAKKGSIQFKTDDGLSQIKQGIVTAVARVYADGGMVMAKKNAIGTGAGQNNNQSRNMFRFIDLT